jgi:hypothetical protein
MGHNDRMGPDRRTFNLVFALGLAAGGVVAFLYLFFFADHPRLGMLAALFSFVGFFWLWANFINADPRPEK